jgi:hypothetical protein
MDGAQPFGLVRDGAVGVTKGKVAWIGRAPDVPAVGAVKLEQQIFLGRAENPGKWKNYLESHVPSASGLFGGWNTSEK